jgi:hypothetical protein
VETSEQINKFSVHYVSVLGTVNCTMRISTFAEEQVATIMVTNNCTLPLLIHGYLPQFMCVHDVIPALGWKTPVQALTGQTPDISKSLHFSVMYHLYSDTIPSTSNLVGRCCYSCL